MAAGVLPPLYETWAAELLGVPVPAETRATCDRCVMVEGADAADEEAFLPEVKCCTFFPELHNFLVGRVLGDDSAAGAASRENLRGRIENRVNVTPLAIGPTAVYQTLYDAASGAFGKSTMLRCPHFLEEDGGRCGVWTHRNGVCATWFCKQDRGVQGSAFWSVMKLFLAGAERAVRFWCATGAGLAEECLAELWAAEGVSNGKHLDAQALNNEHDPGSYRRFWGEWAGREAELYARTAELAAPLLLPDVLRIGGAQVAAAANALRVVHRRLAAAPPARVRRGQAPLLQIGRRPGTATVRHPRMSYDRLELPAAVAAELERFEHGPVPQVIAELRAEGVPIDEELVRRLLDWQVLVEAETP